MTNRELYDIYEKTLRQCCECQTKKLKDQQYAEDIFQDTVLWFLTYDNDKLMDAHTNNHMNALITSYLTRNLFSTTSPYYQRYIRQSSREEEITRTIEDTYEDK